MHDKDEFAVAALLMFLYTGRYSHDCYVGQPIATDTDTRMLVSVKNHTEVILLADKYLLPALKELATLNAKHCAGLLLARQG